MDQYVYAGNMDMPIYGFKQFFAIYMKSKGLRAQSYITSEYKLDHCGSFKQI